MENLSLSVPNFKQLYDAIAGYHREAATNRLIVAVDSQIAPIRQAIEIELESEQGPNSSSQS